MSRVVAKASRSHFCIASHFGAQELQEAPVRIHAAPAPSVGERGDTPRLPLSRAVSTRVEASLLE